MTIKILIRDTTQYKNTAIKIAGFNISEFLRICCEKITIKFFFYITGG